MKTEVTLELRNKIRKEMKIIERKHVASTGDSCAILHFKDEEQDLFDECIDWKKMLDIYFKSSYRGGALKKVGRFIGVRPREIGFHYVEFQVRDFKNPSWKDWFNVEGDGDKVTLFAK